MKELSIKEKAKAYDEAIKKVHKFIDGYTRREISRETLEGIFPELRESEDERIRKLLISGMKNLNYNAETFASIPIKDVIDWLEKQGDKDKLIKELGEYKVKYTQEVLEKHINSMSNKDDERLRKTTIAFLKDFAEQGYENAIECIDWLEKQGEQKPTEVEPKFKVKYAGSEYNVLEVKDIAGVTFYGIEDEPNHIDYVKAEICEIISGYGIKENGSSYPTKPAMFSEQKPAWGEKDEKQVRQIERIVHDDGCTQKLQKTNSRLAQIP